MLEQIKEMRKSKWYQRKSIRRNYKNDSMLGEFNQILLILREFEDEYDYLMYELPTSTQIRLSDQLDDTFQLLSTHRSIASAMLQLIAEKCVTPNEFESFKNEAKQRERAIYNYLAQIYLILTPEKMKIEESSLVK